VSKRTPMFDFTKVSQGVAALLPAWMVAVVVVGVLGMLVPGDAFADRATTIMFGWLPFAFTAGSVVLVVDYVRRLTTGRLTTTQVTGYRCAGVLMAGASAFGWRWSHGLTTAGCVVALLVLLLPTRGRARPSTWTYQG
jgi:hypothetical protein